MNNVLDFITSALPWIAIGLFLATSFSAQSAMRKGEVISKTVIRLSWAPTICCFLVAVLEYVDSDTSGATTWLVLGIIMIVLSFMREKQAVRFSDGDDIDDQEQ